MEELHFTIQHPDGRLERSIVQSPRTLIGSGAHCDVRLSPDQASFEHVVIETTPNGARVQHLTASPQATLDGAPFAVAPLGHSALLRLGMTTLTIERTIAPANAKRERVGAGAIAKLALLGVLICAVAVVAKLPKPEVGPPPSTLPDVFASGSTECPRVDAAEARAVAEESLALADGARERSPFQPREAIAAVKAYELAAACFRSAGNASRAEELIAVARDLEEDTRIELRARRVRLERMLQVQDSEIARQDVVVLRALTHGQHGDYVTWLAKIEQELKVQKGEKR
ncbi:MAG TPA: FHA domain-containing protein [Labilithrix sp.]|nr:FHA domain-containing protein [Labilithrix sp.]